jgi:hypothetical protein
MNLMKKGPEIKLSTLKVPQPLSDLYWDLRDRHLLPAVALLIAAIIATPLLLGESSSDSVTSAVTPGEAEGTLGGISAVPSAETELVAKAAPGLRDYRRRLRNLQAKDPFEQRLGTGGEGAPVEAGGGAESTAPSTTGGGGGSSISSGGSVPSSPSEAPSGGEPPASTEPPAEPSPDSPSLTWFSYAIDVRVVSVGTAAAEDKDKDVSVRRNLPELTVLPGRETPAAIFMGVTKDGKKALMMISEEVRGLFGDGVCVLGQSRCQLLAMEPGLPVTFVYGPRERTFRIEILKLRLLASDRLRRAPLGSGKDGNGTGKRQGEQAEGLAGIAPRSAAPHTD